MNLKPKGSPKVIVAYEGRHISLPPNEDSPGIRDALIRYSAVTGKEVFLRSKSGVRVGNYVGLADLGNIQVQILPKISDGSSINEDSDFLNRMILQSGTIPNMSVQSARLDYDRSTFLDPILERIATGLILRLHHDPPRRYHRETASSSVLRGRLNFKKIVTRPPGRDWLLPIEHHPLQINNPLSQLVKAVIIELKRLSMSSRTRQKFGAALDLLMTVETSDLRIALQGIHLGPYERHWSDIELLAQALVSGRSPSLLSSGSVDLFGLLFSLFDLFEALLRKAFRIADSHNWKLKTITNSRLLTRSKTGGKHQHAIRLKPDYLFVDKSGLPCCVADAKWKVVELGDDIPRLKERDVYQIATYMLHYGVKNGILFFPSFDTSETGSNVVCSEWSVNGLSGGNLILAHVNVLGLVSDKRVMRDAVQKELLSVVSAACA